MKKYDYVIVLGGTHTPGYDFSKDRIDYGMSAYIAEWAGMLIAAGHQSQKMVEYAVSKGMPQDKITAIQASQSTLEDLYLSKKMLDEKGWARALVVTCDFHVPRTKFLAKKVFGEDADVHAVASSTGTVDLVRRLFIERLYITAEQLLLAGSPAINEKAVAAYNRAEKPLDRLLKTLYKTKVITN